MNSHSENGPAHGALRKSRASNLRDVNHRGPSACLPAHTRTKTASQTLLKVRESDSTSIWARLPEYNPWPDGTFVESSCGQSAITCDTQDTSTSNIEPGTIASVVIQKCLVEEGVEVDNTNMSCRLPCSGDSCSLTDTKFYNGVCNAI